MKDEDQQNKTHNTICVGHHHTQEKRRRQIKQKTHHIMCWTPPCTRQKSKTSKIKHTTQYVLDDTIHRTKDEDKQTKKQNTMCWTPSHRRPKTNTNKTIKHNAISVGHHHTHDKRRRQRKQKTQHNMC